MKTPSKNGRVKRPAREVTAELLILADGRVLARNLTPALAQVLREVNPDDTAMGRRAAGDTSPPVRQARPAHSPATHPSHANL